MILLEWAIFYGIIPLFLLHGAGISSIVFREVHKGFRLYGGNIEREDGVSFKLTKRGCTNFIWIIERDYTIRFETYEVERVQSAFLERLFISVNMRSFGARVHQS